MPFGMDLGKAFQGFDDLLDVACATEDLGKDTGKDQGKPTFVKALGLHAADRRAMDQIEQAMVPLGETGIATRALTSYVDELTKAMRNRPGH